MPSLVFFFTANPRLASSSPSAPDSDQHSHGKKRPQKRAKINYALPVVGGRERERAILCSQPGERGVAAEYLPLSNGGLLLHRSRSHSQSLCPSLNRSDTILSYAKRTPELAACSNLTENHIGISCYTPAPWPKAPKVTCPRSRQSSLTCFLQPSSSSGRSSSCLFCGFQGFYFLPVGVGVPRAQFDSDSNSGIGIGVRPLLQQPPHCVGFISFRFGIFFFVGFVQGRRARGFRG